MQKKFKLFKQKGDRMTFTGTERVINVSSSEDNTELDLLKKEAEELSKKKNMKYEWVESKSL